MIISHRGQNFLSLKIEKHDFAETIKLRFIDGESKSMTDEDVTFVKLVDCTIEKVPQGLTTSFPNMKILWILNSKLKKICRDDLAEYKNLEEFRFNFNEIEFLPGDLFEGFQNLKAIEFCRNKLQIIEPNILDGHDKLQFIDFRENPNYRMFHSEYRGNTESNKAHFAIFKHDLFERYPKKCDCVKELIVSERNLKQEVSSLKSLFAKQEADLEREKLKNIELERKLNDGFYEDLKQFTQNEDVKDFSIQIDDRIFPVHKFLLAARSPTLAEILKNNPEVENLNLVDIAVDTFEIIQKFIYFDELPEDNRTNFLRLFAAAGKLKIKRLTEYATTKLFESINEDNAIEIFKLSYKYDHEKLRQKSFSKIKEFYPKCDFKDDWDSKYELVMKTINNFHNYEEANRKLVEELNSD